MSWLVEQYLPLLYSFRHIIQFCFAQLVCRCQPAIKRGHLNQIAALIELSSPCHPYRWDQETCAAVFTKTPPSARSNQARRGIYIVLYFYRIYSTFLTALCQVFAITAGHLATQGLAASCVRRNAAGQNRRHNRGKNIHVHICVCVYGKKIHIFCR